jgi:hypothetical protein
MKYAVKCLEIGVTEIGHYGKFRVRILCGRDYFLGNFFRDGEIDP